MLQLKNETTKLYPYTIGIALMLCLSLAMLAKAQETSDVQGRVSPADEKTIAAFRARVRKYTKRREAIEAEMPKLSKEATPEQIRTHRTELGGKVRAARAGAKRGEVFTPAIARYIRSTIRDTLKGAERAEFRKTVLEAETKGVPLKVNYTYPEDKELVQMPPTLLLKLPQIPKQVRYRFVGRNLLLVDRENDLIVDYMFNALP
ncbi:MAG: hypothetical protein ACR2HX_16345 [Pyrinomonadaceae bacterium]